VCGSYMTLWRYRFRFCVRHDLEQFKFKIRKKYVWTAKIHWQVLVYTLEFQHLIMFHIIWMKPTCSNIGQPARQSYSVFSGAVIILHVRDRYTQTDGQDNLNQHSSAMLNSDKTSEWRVLLYENFVGKHRNCQNNCTFMAHRHNRVMPKETWRWKNICIMRNSARFYRQPITCTFSIYRSGASVLPLLLTHNLFATAKFLPVGLY